MRKCTKCLGAYPREDYTKKSARCRRCRADDRRDYYLRNKERIAAYGKEYRQAHPELYREAKKKHYAANTEKEKARRAKYHKSKEQTPCVYKVICPDGRFYVGSTKFAPETRVKFHWNRRNSTLYKHCTANAWLPADLVAEAIGTYTSLEDARAAERRLLAELVGNHPDVLNHNKR